MSDLEIIGGPASNFVWACRIVCAEKRVPYKLTSVMPHTPEVTAIHPFGKIPVMRFGEVTLAESRAIYGYIERMFDGPPLVPADPIKAAKVEQWLSIVNTTIDPVWMRQYVAGYVFPGTPDKSPNRAAIDAALPKMEQQFPVMDAAVAGGYLVGNTFTLADANFIPILYYVSKFPESSALLAKSKNLRKYLERHLARKSVQETMPHAQPGTAGTAARPDAAETVETEIAETDEAAAKSDAGPAVETAETADAAATADHADAGAAADAAESAEPKSEATA